MQTLIVDQKYGKINFSLIRYGKKFYAIDPLKLTAAATPAPCQK